MDGDKHCCVREGENSFDFAIRFRNGEWLAELTVQSRDWILSTRGYKNHG
jgi:hypothetical protein